MSDYSIREATEAFAGVATEIAREHFTGKITLTLHTRDGSIARIEETRIRDLRRTEAVESNEKRPVSDLGRKALERGGVSVEAAI